MFRAFIEILFIVLIIVVARALLGSIFRGVSNASSNSFQRPDSRTTGTPQQAEGPQLGGELHKDPVCGTYVAETAPFHRQVGDQTFYYCSSTCRDKHALAAR